MIDKPLTIQQLISLVKECQLRSNKGVYMASEPMIKRFAYKVRMTDDCWEWIGSKTPVGYGQLRVGNIRTSPHRFIYEYFNGEIPIGLEIDHLCNKRHCVNPQHLEAVTHAENRRRARSERCSKGHKIGETKQGKRQCRTCYNAYERQYQKEWRKTHKRAL